MAKKQGNPAKSGKVDNKTVDKVDNKTVDKVNQGDGADNKTHKEERSVDEIEAELQIDQESEGSEEELSEESDDDIEGLSSEDEEEEQNKGGHSVNLTTNKKQDKQSKDAKQEKKGIIYIGRIPKGFEEFEMKKYFSQFGDIERLRISRNKKSGASKHYGYIQFKHYDVAKIAAETMNNYLIYGHLLKVHVIEEPKKNLFIGDRDRKFRANQWQQKLINKHNNLKSQDEWDKLQDGFNSRKQSRSENLKTKGINYSL